MGLDILALICSAIATQEGWFSTDPKVIPRTHNNPGNLRAAPWLPSANTRIVEEYWVADTPAEGIAGLYHQVALMIARGETLKQLITAWAPASDGNNPSVYLQNVMHWTGIADANVPLQTLLAVRKLG